MRRRATRHGPVISDGGAVAAGLTGPASAPAYAIAMRWTALDPTPARWRRAGRMTTARSGRRVHARHRRAPWRRCRTWWWPTPGTSPWCRPGACRCASPTTNQRARCRRPAGSPLRLGRLPRRGRHAARDRPGARLDRHGQPAHPCRATIRTTSAAEWAPPWRYQRIAQMIGQGPGSLDDLRGDAGRRSSLAALRLLPLLKRAAPEHPLAAAAHAGWQRSTAAWPATAAPLIFWAWVRHLALDLLRRRDGLHRLGFEHARAGAGYLLEGVMEREDAWWCDDKGTPAVETCQQINDRALARALDELQTAQGRTSPLALGPRAPGAQRAPPVQQGARAGKGFELRAPVGGDTYTVNVSRVNLKPDLTTGELYLDEHGPSLRAIYDLGDLAIRASCTPRGNRASRSRRTTAASSSAGRRSTMRRCGRRRRPERCCSSPRSDSHLAEQGLALRRVRPPRRGRCAAHEVGGGHEGVEHARILALAVAAHSFW